MGRQVELKAYTLSAASSPFLQRKDEAVRATLEIPMKIEKLVCYPPPFPSSSLPLPLSISISSFLFIFLSFYLAGCRRAEESRNVGGGKVTHLDHTSSQQFYI